MKTMLFTGNYLKFKFKRFVQLYSVVLTNLKTVAILGRNCALQDGNAILAMRALKDFQQGHDKVELAGRSYSQY